MAKLSGILKFSMGGFLCLRGFAKFKELSRISEPNPDVQRDLMKDHQWEMVDFLNKGEYRFFPEVVLSVSLATENNFREVEEFFSCVYNQKAWKGKNLGIYTISIFHHGVGDKNVIAHISFDETYVKLNRIDGNHRLSAAELVDIDFDVPFCLILNRSLDEESRYSRAIFYNINAKQKSLQLEENLKVILDSPETFTDSRLIEDPTFGWKYYLARKTLQTIDFTYFPAVNSYICNSKYSFFVDLYGFLIESDKIEKADIEVDNMKARIVDIEKVLVESEITATTTNIAVIGTLAYYRLTDSFKYRNFLSWVKRNNIGNVDKLHMEDVIRLYDEIAEHIPKKVFLARWYPSENDPEFTKSVHRINAVKEVVKELNLELTDLGTQDTGTFDIRKMMYSDIRNCDIFIADLTGARHNVMVEVGYALKHIDTGRMIFYFQETDNCKSVPFDINHFAYDKIQDSAEIRTKTKGRIQNILKQAQNGKI